ncbi:hypothetical protein VTI28DRAFT_7377 [Corynascus sepedonium]
MPILNNCPNTDESVAGCRVPGLKSACVRIQLLIAEVGEASSSTLGRDQFRNGVFCWYSSPGHTSQRSMRPLLNAFGGPRG